METLITAITMNTIWFVTLTSLCIFCLFYLVINEKIYSSGICVIIYFVLLHLVLKKNIISSIAQNPKITLISLFVYILTGFIWSIIKWWLYVNKQAIKYKQSRYEWLLEQKDEITTRTNDIPNELKEISLETEIPEYLLEKWAGAYKIQKPLVYTHKQKIAHWIIYWPISIFWSIIEDFLGKITKIIVFKIRFIYDAITEKAFKNTKDIEW